MQNLPLPQEPSVLYQAKCKDFDEMLLEFEDFKCTSKLYEQELESQLAETNNKYETLYREEQKIKSELINSKKEKMYLEARYEQILQENAKLKENMKTLENKVVGLENDLELMSSQNRQLETQIDSFERQINSDFEKYALLQIEFEEFQAENKRNLGDLMEQLKEKDAQIQKNQQFLTPAKMLKPSISSNLSTRVSEIENVSSPRFEYFGSSQNFSVRTVKTRKKTMETNAKENVEINKGEERKSLKVIDDIIKNLEKNMQFFC